MKKAILKLTDECWAEYLQELQRRAQACGRVYQELPKQIFFAGAIYAFDPFCEVPEHIGRQMARKRPYIKLVEVKTVQEIECSRKVNRENSEQRFLCSFCDKEYKMAHHRNSHETKCKGEE